MPARSRPRAPGRGSSCTAHPARPHSGGARWRYASARSARLRRTARIPSGCSPRRPPAASGHHGLPMAGGVPNLESTVRRLEICREHLVELLELFAELKDREVQPAVTAAAVEL